MNNPSWEDTEKGQVGGHDSIPLENPPPYSIASGPGFTTPQIQPQPQYQYNNPDLTPSGYTHSVNPGFIQQPAVVVAQPTPSPLDRLGQVLIPDRFTIFPTGGRMGFLNAGRTTVVQLRDAANLPVLSFLTKPGRNISSDEDNHVQTPTVITLTDPAGQNLLTGTDNGMSTTVTSGGQVLGIVNSQGICSSTFTVQSPMGDSLFLTVGMSSAEASSSGSGIGGCFSSPHTEYSFISGNGVALGRLGPSSEHPGQMEVTYASDITHDTRTKALLLYTAYFLYMSFFAETSMGKIGVRGMMKRLFFGFCLCGFVPIFLMAIILLIVFA